MLNDLSKAQTRLLFNVGIMLLKNEHWHTVLRIQDVYPGSKFFPSRIPDLAGSKRFPDPDQHPQQRI
jgi:hypothetical protein